MAAGSRKIWMVAGLIVALWLGTKYALPALLPFLAGAGVALAAEPLVGLGTKRLKMPRPLAAALGVTVMLLAVAGGLFLLGALALRELGQLAGAVPDLRTTASRGIILLQDWCVAAADYAPESVRPLVTQTVLNVFDDGTVFMDEISAKIPQVIAAILSWVPDGLLGLGTGVLAAFMISVRLPKLRQLCRERIPQSWQQMLGRVRKSLGGWLRAQGMLALVTYAIVTVGFFLLRVPYGPAWAAFVAVVDAVPLLGTGIVMVPWAVVEFMQGQQMRGILLLGIFACATLARSTLEPRFLGKQLGLDPLMTLLALYLGYRMWGFLGLIAAPMVAAAVKTAMESYA